MLINSNSVMSQVLDVSLGRDGDVRESCVGGRIPAVAVFWRLTMETKPASESRMLVAPKSHCFGGLSWRGRQFFGSRGALVGAPSQGFRGSRKVRFNTSDTPSIPA